MQRGIRLKSTGEESLAAGVSDGNMTHKGGAQTMARPSGFIIPRYKLTNITVTVEINASLIYLSFFMHICLIG